MNRFDKILQNIKSLKIQGANAVAKSGIRAFLLQPDEKSAGWIFSTRPTEPLMQNAVNYLLNSENPKKNAKNFFSYLKMADIKIAKTGAKLIKNDMNIFTHCHSSTIASILKYAKKHGKKFVVYNTETSPSLQGRIMAKELIKSGIKVIHVVDTATEYSLKKCDLFLFGADAFLPSGVVNKVGTEMYCQLASLYKIPRYTAGISLKFTKKVKLEYRKPAEVWNEKEKLIITINPAFDNVSKKLLTGVISEFGILTHRQFVKKAKENLRKWR